jgi:hypothetical protein
MQQLSAFCWLLVCLALFASCTVATFVLLKSGCRGPVSQFTYNLSWQHSYRELEHFASYQQSHLKAPALYGVRYIIMVWIMMVHTAAVVNFQFLRKFAALFTFIKSIFDLNFFRLNERFAVQQEICYRSKKSLFPNLLKSLQRVRFKWIR